MQACWDITLQCPLTCGQVGWTLQAIVRADFLNQSVVCAVERHVDADDLERSGAHPGDVALGVLLITCLWWVVVAQHHLLVAFGFLGVHSAVERLWIFGVDHALALQVELHLFRRWHEADGHVAYPRGVVAEEDAERPVTMIHNLPQYQQIQFDCLYIWIKVPPDERPGPFRCSMNFHDGLKLYL